MKRLIIIVLLAALQTAAVLLLSAQEPGQEPEKPQPPHEIPDDKWCLDCHADYAEGAFVHEPVTEEMCEACHAQPDEALHVFEMEVNQVATCATCHDMPTGEHGHQPVSEGSCTACHDPHHGETKMLLRFADEEELCASCHEDDGPDLNKEHVHGPADAGMCTSCHLPHVSDQPKLLSDDPVTLCLSCHEDLSNGLDNAVNIHVPVDEDCAMCHDPHSSDHPNILKQPALMLCFDCHDAVRERTELSVDHSVVTDGASCMNCHQPHHSSFPALLSSSPIDACLSCHAEAVEGDDGRQLAAVGEWMKLEFPHGPVKEGDCSACHDPHGADHNSILREAYPDGFYTTWDPKRYQLCFGCHEESAFRDPQTASLTEFRDGDVNLHHLHVNRESKGRSCSACHKTHASSLPNHMAETVPFGKWNMPLRFIESATGGSCSPGCHATATYKRTPRPILDLNGD